MNTITIHFPDWIVYFLCALAVVKAVMFGIELYLRRLVQKNTKLSETLNRMIKKYEEKLK